MNKILLYVFCAFILMLASSSVSEQSMSGIAGFTGSPGSFGTCNNCHGGGFSSAFGTTISAVPSFSNNEYMPDSGYMITVNAQAAGFARFGFDCEILTPSGTNAGTISPNFPGAVKVLQAGTRSNAVHTAPHNTATAAFTFPWKAPPGGTAVVYAIVNAVNGNNNTTGDFPLTPVSLSLSPKAPAPQDTTITSLKNTWQEPSLNVYPLPATHVATVAFRNDGALKAQMSLTDGSGRIVSVTEHEIRQGEVQLAVPVSRLSTGYYRISVKAGNRLLTGRLVVE